MRSVVLPLLGVLIVLTSCATPDRSSDAEDWWASGDGKGLAAVFGPGADAMWELAGAPAGEGGPFSVESDPILRQPVLIGRSRLLALEGRTAYGPCVISCKVRIATSADAPNLYFRLLAGGDPADPKRKRAGVRIQGRYNGPLYVTAVDTRVAYVTRAYDKIMPTWSDAIRIPIEKDMGELRPSQDHWVDLRLALEPEGVRCWIDDRLVLDRHDPELNTSGRLRLEIQKDVRLADFRVRPLTPTDPMFETVRLDGYVRDRALTGGRGVAAEALPFGKRVEIEGIPFVFASRSESSPCDHIDVGRSLLRQGNMQGYFPSRTERFIGAMTVDPARIQLRIPNGRYDAMYLVAGFAPESHDIPLLSASFYRPGAGFPMVFETNVPSILDESDRSATRLPVTLENGRRVNLWLVKIPLEPEALTSFSDLDVLEVELGKKIHQYRSYPDPFIYGWHPAGLPSGVHVYAVTLHRPEVRVTLEPKKFGHVWTDPEVPSYEVALQNRGNVTKSLTVQWAATSYDGKESLDGQLPVPVGAGREAARTFSIPVKRNGLHKLDVTVRDGEASWTETRYFARLHKDTRAPFWKDGDGPFFGYWSYHGGHHTPPATNIMTVMHAAGARGPVRSSVPEIQALADRWKWIAGANAWPVSPQWGWAGDDHPDPEKIKAFKASVIEKFRKAQGDDPELVTFFPEPHVSRDLTAGNPPDYWGDPPLEMNEQERKTFKVLWNTAKVAAEAVRETWPNTKILIPWGDPLFIVPFLREGFPKDLIDGSGLDMIGFERLPEQQIAQQSTHRLYILRNEYEKFGMPDPLLYYVEGAFVPTEPGACTWEEQAERYHRWTLLSLAYGIERFYSGWFAYDCGNYYGAEHYGGCGIQRRIPYSDPKPAYAHYATMTRMLERSKFEGWLPTGSHSVYALRFSRTGRDPVTVFWTIRGTRPVTVQCDKDATLQVTDSMDNTETVKTENRAAAFTIGASPLYVSGPAAVTNIALGAPDHSDAVDVARQRNQETWFSGPMDRDPPVGETLTIADLGDGTWSLTDERDEIYEQNNYDMRRYRGRMSAGVVDDADREGTFLAVHLEPQETERKLMPWYSVFRPEQPVVIPGKAVALGLWVKAHSDWGRVVYVLKDARGEEWRSVGTKDQWNCNDTFGWSKFCFDGWRYLRFELPSHSEYDSFREFGTTWWGSVGGDPSAGSGQAGIVDLPLTLDKVIVERRTHVLYVNDIQPADPGDVLLGALVAEYHTAFDSTEDAVALNRVRMPLPKGDFGLPNPIAEMEDAGELDAVVLEGVKMPDWGYDGTRAHVQFREAPNAAEYEIWLSAYPDGRGAVSLGRMKESGGLVRGLRPAMPLYLWVTYSETAEKGETPRKSKPSNRLDIELVDAFGQK